MRRICRNRLNDLERTRRRLQIFVLTGPLPEPSLIVRECCKNVEGLGAACKQPRALRMLGLIAIVVIPIATIPIVTVRVATVSEYLVGLFGRVVRDPFHASPVSSVGGIATAFVRGEF